MFGHHHARNAIDSLIGMSARIDGDLYFSGGLRVDGVIHGSVIADAGQPNLLVISEHGRIEGEVRVANLVVNGHINGPVHATELLELQPKARIVGDVFYHVLEVHGGAVVSGLLTHQAKGEPTLHLAASEA